MRQLREGGQPVVLAATEELHIRSAVGTANDRQDGRDQDVVPRRKPGPFHVGIFAVVEAVHQGHGGAGSRHEGKLRGGKQQPRLYPIPISPIHNAIALATNM